MIERNDEVKLWRLIFSILGFGALLLFFYHAWGVLIPFILGLAAAYLVYPLVDQFVSLGLRQDRVVIVLYVFLLGVFFILGFLFIPSLITQTNLFIHDLPTYADAIDRTIVAVNNYMQAGFGRLLGSRAELLAIPFKADVFIDHVFARIPDNLINVAHLGMWIFIIPFVAFFALAQGRQWIRNIFQWTPAPYVESLLGLMAEINNTLGGFVRGTLLDAVCVWLLTMSGLYVLGIEGALFLGVLTGLLNIVPFLAPIVGGSMAILFAIIQGQGPGVIVGIVILYVLVRMFDDFFFIPFVIGSSVRIHPVLALLAVLSGFELGGILGLLFAIPFAAVLKVVVSVILRSHQNNGIHRIPAVYS